MAVTAILVAYRTPELLEQCLGDLTESQHVTRIIVVDNDAANPECRLVAEGTPRTFYIPMLSNAGFARAVNRGLREVVGGDVLLINPDCRLSPHSLAELVHTLDVCLSCGIAAPHLLNPGRNLSALSAGRDPNLWRVFCHYSGLAAALPRWKSFEGWHYRAAAHADRVRAVDWASGACLLIRGEVLDTLGGLNERWFMYAEDIEYCRRARQRGWQVLHVPAARAVHVLGAASDTGENGPVFSRWVSTLIDYYRLEWTPDRWRDYLYRVVLAGGLMSRAIRARTMVVSANGQARATWRREARNNTVWARRALFPRTVGLDEPPTSSEAGEFT